MQKLKSLFVAGAAVAASAATSVYAAVPAAATTAITEAGTDAQTIGTAVFVVLVGIAAFKYMRRAM